MWLAQHSPGMFTSIIEGFGRVQLYESQESDAHLAWVARYSSGDLPSPSTCAVLPPPRYPCFLLLHV